MHLGFIEGPTVSHNLISAQVSHVLLLKFQIAHRLNILMASRSKKGTQIHFPFLSKVPANEPPPGFPTGSLWRERPVYRAFSYHSETSFLVSPVKEPSLRVPFTKFLAEGCPTTRALLHSSVKVPGIRVPPPHTKFPSDEKGPNGERCPNPETFLTYFPESPMKELPPCWWWRIQTFKNFLHPHVSV
jgi:hypothetical protein